MKIRAILDIGEKGPVYSGPIEIDDAKLKGMSESKRAEYLQTCAREYVEQQIQGVTFSIVGEKPERRSENSWRYRR